MTIDKKYVGAIQSTMTEITDLLKKSGYPMEKEDDLQDQEMEGGDPQMGGEQEMGQEDDVQLDPQQDGESYEEEPEMGQEDGGEEEGDYDSHMAEMQEHAASMSDEDLQMLLQMLTQEMESRQGGEEEGMEGQDPQMGQDDLQQSSDKEEYIKLHKSMSKILDRVEGISKEVANLKKAPAPRARVRTKAAASNTSDILHKSKTPEAAPKMERLSKSETIKFLYNQIKARNPQVTSSTVARVNVLADGSPELHKAQDDLVKEGVNFPKL